MYYKNTTFYSGRQLNNKDSTKACQMPNNKKNYLVLQLALVIYKGITYLNQKIVTLHP